MYLNLTICTPTRNPPSTGPGLAAYTLPTRVQLRSRMNRPREEDNLLGTYPASSLAEADPWEDVLYKTVSSALHTFFSSANCQSPLRPTGSSTSNSLHSFNKHTTFVFEPPLSVKMKTSTILAFIATAVLSNATPISEEKRDYAPAGYGSSMTPPPVSPVPNYPPHAIPPPQPWSPTYPPTVVPPPGSPVFPPSGPVPPPGPPKFPTGYQPGYVGPPKVQPPTDEPTDDPSSTPGACSVEQTNACCNGESTSVGTGLLGPLLGGNCSPLAESKSSFIAQPRYSQ